MVKVSKWNRHRYRAICFIFLFYFFAKECFSCRFFIPVYKSKFDNLDNVIKKKKEKLLFIRFYCKKFYWWQHKWKKSKVFFSYFEFLFFLFCFFNKFWLYWIVLNEKTLKKNGNGNVSVTHTTIVCIDNMIINPINIKVK